jgi:hypothetical protein
MTGRGKTGNMERGCCWDEGAIETKFVYWHCTVSSSQRHLVSTWTLSFGKLLRVRERWNLIVTRPGDDCAVASSKPGQVKWPSACG